MTVGELIERLRAMPQDAVVELDQDDYGMTEDIEVSYEGNTVEIRGRV